MSVVFSDDFSTLNTELWEWHGNHTNYNVTVADGWLHVIFNKQSSQPGVSARFVCVNTKIPFNLSNKTLCVRFDLTPKKLQPEMPSYEYYVGVMIANKRSLTGHPLINPDPDLKAVIFALRLAFQTPIQKLSWVVDRGVANLYPGTVFVLFPPSEYEMNIGLTKVITMEEGVEDATIPLPADPTSLYIHLFTNQIEFVTSGGDVYLLPSRSSYDYVKVLTGAAPIEYPRPEVVIAQQTSSLLSALMVIMMIHALISIIGRI